MKQEYEKAPLIQRIQIDLKEDKKNELVSFIRNNKMKMENDREEWFRRQQKYLNNYDDFISAIRKGPWEGSSNVHMPFTAIMVKSYHARLFNMLTQDDIVSLVGMESTDDALATIYRRIYNWYISDYINEFRGITGVIDELCMDIATVGFGILIKSWELKQKKILQIKENVDEDELKKEFAELKKETKEGKVSASAYKETWKIITEFKGTMLHTIPYESALFPNYIPECNNLDYPSMVNISVEESLSQINLKAQQGIYLKEAVDEVIKGSSSKDSKSSQQQQAQQKKGQLTGSAETSSAYSGHDKKYGINYAFCHYDIDDDGVAEDLVVTISDTFNILNVNFVNRLSNIGRPIFKFDCFIKPRQGYSRGVVEQVYSLQEEMDLNHNMRLDYLQLQTCPFGVYRSSSTLKNEPIRIAPGKWIPVEDTGDLRVITFPPNATALQGEEGMLWGYGQQMLSVSPQSMGFVGSQVGPTRSTSGVVSLLNQLEKEFRPVATRVAKQWERVVRAVIEDIDDRLDASIKRSILGPLNNELERFIMPDGKTPIEEVEFEALRMGQRMNLKLNVANVSMSEEMRRNNAYQIFQMSVAPSALQQTGVVSPKNIYNAYMNWLRTFDYINPEDFATMPQNYLTEPLTLYQEIMYIQQGMIPPLALNDNHQEKTNGLLSYAQSPEYQEAKQLGATVKNVDDVMQKTINQHTDMIAKQALPNPTGMNGMDQNEVMANAAPQQVNEQRINYGAQNEPGRPGEPQPALPAEGMAESSQA